MIISYHDPRRHDDVHEHLTADEVIQKTQAALDDPTVKAIETYKMAPRWQRRQWDREARKGHRRGTFRRTYR